MWGIEEHTWNGNINLFPLRFEEKGKAMYVANVFRQKELDEFTVDCTTRHEHSHKQYMVLDCFASEYRVVEVEDVDN